MRNKSWMIAAVCLMMTGVAMAGPSIRPPRPPWCPEKYDVVWTTPSTDARGSMPIGNGSLVANVWVTADGTIHALLARTDSWTEINRLAKVGLVHFKSPALAAAMKENFTQRTNLYSGTLEIVAGKSFEAIARIWVDAHAPVIHVELTSHAGEAPMTATIERCRKERIHYATLTCSDMYDRVKNAPKMFIEPDELLNLKNAVGLVHHNKTSLGPAVTYENQGLADAPAKLKSDPLLHRTFGLIVRGNSATKKDISTLVSPSARRHHFRIYADSLQPATVQKWTATMGALAKRIEAESPELRFRTHSIWWRQFWQRSYIHFTNGSARVAPAAKESVVPANPHPVRVGADQNGGNKFDGTIHSARLTYWPFDAKVFLRLIAEPSYRQMISAGTISLLPAPKTPITALAAPRGLTCEAWLTPKAGATGRIIDKTTVGKSDGLLFDVYPANSLRIICGSRVLMAKNVLTPGKKQHVAATTAPDGKMQLFVDGKLVASGGKTAAPAGPLFAGLDDAYILSRAYTLQRYVTACSARGAYPLKFNGQIITVGKMDEDWDYRRWGPGYWWQNTRLPYISMCAAGDFEMMKPLFKMYSDMLPLLKYRTRKHCGHGGAYLSECTYPWGGTFLACYGRSFASRKPSEDKFQDSGWHKYEWVAGLELVAFMLDYYEHTGDEAFLRETALPMAEAVLTFFNEHYPKRDANGKMVMNPSQALEMWWNCTNPMPEIAGVRSLLRRVKRIDAKLLPAKFQAMCTSLGTIVPPIPTRKFGDKTALAPADKFAQKRNFEAPELYALYPFKLYGPGRENNDWALTALRNRLYKNHMGWAQDDMWMACLGLGVEARDRLVRRAKGIEPGYRFPVMWQRGFDWVPDQDHGGVLTAATQMLLLQTDGKTIDLAPAMPGDWNATFKLHAPYNTTIEGVVENGKVTSYTVTPKSRRKDVVLRPAPKQ